MADKLDLLIEIGTEELPPQALLQLSQAFHDQIIKGLEQQSLRFASSESFATPRRLAVRVMQLDTAQPDQSIARKGPALKAAYDAEGNPTKAALGFARSCGVDLNDLGREETPKGTWLVFHKLEPGKAAQDLIPNIVEHSLAALPIPKRMRWGNKDAEFVRPVHWILLLLGSKVIDADIMGLPAARTTLGHRFHHPEPIEITTPEEYEAKLLEARVVASFDARRRMVQEQAEAAVAEEGYQAVILDALLDEVTALNEWPVAVVGEFDAEFLQVPKEALIETMQKNQKYFPVVDMQGKLVPRFITTSNISSLDPQQVKAGNERVIRPRFKDAAFFWEQDLKRPLDQLQNALGKVVFQNKLGTLLEKSQRISRNASHIAEAIGLDPTLANRAGQLCKCDLLTNMVGEFAGLQGIMGRYYAESHGEDACVSAAMEEHYLPRHAGDRLPTSPCGQTLAIADKLDSLVGIFAIGQRPTGVKDPYALRRASLGVLRILIETPMDLDLRDLLQQAAQALVDKVDTRTAGEEVFEYMMERLRGYYGDKGIGPDIVDAVLANEPTVPTDIDRRIHAVVQFRSLPEAESLAAANKRIRNILRKTDDSIPEHVNEALLHDESERSLFQKVSAVSGPVQAHFTAGEYSQALTALAALREPVDNFFDKVMVMCEDGPTRANRLALLRKLSDQFSTIADISRLQ